jgi:hypothetical protein
LQVLFQGGRKGPRANVAESSTKRFLGPYQWVREDTELLDKSSKLSWNIKGIGGWEECSSLKASTLWGRKHSGRMNKTLQNRPYLQKTPTV